MSDTAIEALRYSEFPNSSDAISRQAAIDAARDWYEGLICGSFKGLEKRLRALPSAQPERKMGKWIYNSPVTMKCDQCGFVIKDWDWHRFKFCPNCDCDMRG